MDSKRQFIRDLVAHAISTLPDSMTGRRKILVGCLAVIPKKPSELRAQLVTMLHTLDEHDRVQQTLPLLFASMKEESGS